MKIGFCGTMSVGKTTLVNILRKFKEFEEYKIRTERSKHLMSLGIPLNTDSTLKGQTIFLSERSAELMQDKIIIDRTVLDVMVFAQCSKSMNYLEKDNFIHLAADLIHEYDYIFYVSPEGVEIEDNGVRETNAEYRQTIHHTIKFFMNKYIYRIKNLVEIKGNNEERIKLVREALNP